MTSYYVAGQPVRLGKILGEGGEAVVKMGDTSNACFAYKLYKPGASPVVMQMRARKIQQALQRKLPDCVYGPLAPVTDKPKNGSVVGFKMRLFPDGYLNLEDLADRAIWTSFKLSQRQIVRLFINIHNLLAELHQQGVVVGDLSSMNVQFHPEQLSILACDVDSWQFGADTPGLIGTMDFLAPRQYNKDLETGQHPFLPEDDWWAYTINLFRSLLRIHPFREGKTGLPLTSDRVLAGLHVLNPALPYPPPRVALPLLALPDTLLAFFKRIFDEQRVEQFPAALLEQLDKGWVTCSAHQDGVYVYARERAECPHCAKDRSVPDLAALTKPLANAVVFNLIYEASAPRRVLFAKVVGANPQSIFMLCVDYQDNLSMICLTTTGQAREMPLQIKFVPGQSYDANADTLMITDKETVTLFDLHSGQMTYRFTSETYARHTVAALGTVPIWLIGASMVRGEVFYGQLHHKELMPLSYGNVWFTAHSQEAQDVVVGFTNLLGRYRWFVYQAGLFHELPAVTTAPHEFLVDWRVSITGDNFAIMRRLQNPQDVGRSVVNFYQKTAHIGEMTLPAEQFTGLPALGDSLLYPTEGGILRMKPTDPPAILPGTENVPANSFLLAVQQHNESHLFVVNEANASVYQVTR